MSRSIGLIIVALYIGIARNCIAIPPSEPSPGPQYPFIPQMTFVNQGKLLLWVQTTARDHSQSTIAWCDAATGNKLKALAGFEAVGYSYASVSGSSNGRFIAATPFQDGIRLWDLDKKEQLSFPENNRVSFALAFAPTDNPLLVKYQNEIVAYQVPSLEKQGSFEDTYTGRRSFTPQNQSIAVSADGKRVAALFNGVRLWDIQSRKEIAQIDTPDEHNQVAISGDGNLVAYTTRSRGSLCIWDYKNKRQRFVLNRRYHPTVAFSPTEKILSASNGKQGLHFIDLKSGEVVRTFPQFKDGAYPVAFSPDGKRIAAAHGGEIRIIDLATNKEVVIKIPPIEEQKAE